MTGKFICSYGAGMRIQFDTMEELKAHYKSDWHCYNLKRKVAALPPLTLEDFEKRKAVADADKAKLDTKEKKKNHHKEMKAKKQKKKEEEMETEEVLEKRWKNGDNPRYRWFLERSAELDAQEDDEEWEDMSEDDEEDVEEMEEDQIEEDFKAEDFLCVEDGKHQREIPVNECLFSGHISKNIDANILYMERNYSFFIPMKEYLVDKYGLMRYLGRKVGVGNICITCNETGRAFYSLQAVRDHMIKMGHVRLEMNGEKALEYSEFYDFPDSDDEQEQETDENMVGEMVLADGSTIGHRSLWKYYKQSFDPRMALVPSKRANQINKYRAIGWYGDVTNQQAQINEFKKVAKFKKKMNLRVGLRNNMNDNMKHFKRRDGFCM